MAFEAGEARDIVTKFEIARQRDRDGEMSGTALNTPLSFAVMVAAPTLFWLVMIFIALRVIGSDMSRETAMIVAAGICGFLTIVWSMLVANRSGRRGE